jgi:predicted nucleotidyltransferase
MLRPFDYVLARNGLLFVVNNHEERDGHIVAVPKYAPFRFEPQKFQGKTWHMLKDEWSRVSDLFASSTSLSARLQNRMRDLQSCAGGYLLSRADIVEIFRATDGLVRLQARPNSSETSISRAANRLIDLAKEAVPLHALGLTGSLLFGGEIEDFSDIDLVVYGSEHYLALADHLRRQTSSAVRFRTIREWKEFHDRFTVRSNLTREEFAHHMANKADQIYFDTIPVSIFAVRSYPADFEHLDRFTWESANSLQLQCVTGIVQDISESMFLPAVYLIQEQEAGRMLACRSDNRAEISQARVGDRVEVSGYVNSGNDMKWIRTGSSGFIRLTEPSSYPVLVSRNIAYSHPFLCAENESSEVIYSRRNRDLATLFELRQLKLYELNRGAMLIFELSREGRSYQEIHRALIAECIHIPAHRIVEFIDMIKAKGFLT